LLGVEGLVSSRAVVGGAHKPFKLGRRPPLDGLRAVAIVAVIGVHYGPEKVPGGFLGVDVFFVLSGFLITALLVQEREVTTRISMPSFYMRRARRLLPALLVMLAAVAVYGALYPHRPENAHVWRDTLAALFYASDFVQAAAHHVQNGMLSHTWSLSIEEQFYLLWPALFALLLYRGGPRKVICFVVALGAACTFTDGYLLLSQAGASATRVQFGLDSRGGGLLIGCLFGLLVAWDMVPQWLRRAAPVVTWVGLPILAFAFLTPRYGFVEGNPYHQFVEAPLLVGLVTALVILGVIYAPLTWPARMLSTKPATWVGRVSYGIYLWHFPIAHIFAPGSIDFGMGKPGAQAGRVLATVVIVCLSWYLVEQPILQGRWGRGQRRTPGTPAEPVTVAAAD
jgi:peptidoglycan/LPS O-acetylase OafA/YrhL